MQESHDPPRPLHRESLLTPPVWWFLIFSLVANSSLSLLFAVLPLFAEETTGLALAAGLVTGTMMLATVIVELGTPRLMSALGYRRVMEIGVALMGLPALLLIAFPNLATILAVAAARGAGLAITVVAGTALAPQLFPAHRRAEGLGIYGVAASIPAIALLPLGLWLAERYGFDLVFTGAAGLTVAGLA
ncbi:MAG: MFS transporter, partial [Chloroflexia bacterium]|nr:MFS transporter [Chloroflexia bacterium]